MAEIHHSEATLRIFGDDLQPADISRLLNCEPTSAEVKGDVIRYASGRERTVRCGRWSLSARRAEPADLDGQIKWLMSRVTSDLDRWQDLTSRYDVDVFCGLFMQTGNDGLGISPQAMLSLGARGIELVLDIYSPVEEA
jgi:hypothetical protein